MNSLIVRLETETGHFVVATRLPPYQMLPTGILWGDRMFFLYEAGANGFPSRYRERFWVGAVETSDEDPCPQKEPSA